MHPPTTPHFWQGFAQRPRGCTKPFAMLGSVGNPWAMVGRMTLCAPLCLGCYPSPSRRSGPFVAGPVFSDTAARANGRGFADGETWAVQSAGFFFMDVNTAVKSTARTTMRGNEPCINFLSSSRLHPPPLRAACRPRPSAALPVLSRVRPLQMPWMKTWSPVRHLAVWPGLQPAASRVCRAARPIDLTAASGRRPLQRKGSSGQNARVALFYCASRPGRV